MVLGLMLLLLFRWFLGFLGLRLVLLVFLDCIFCILLLRLLVLFFSYTMRMIVLRRFVLESWVYSGIVLFQKRITRLNCSGVNLGAHSTSIQQTVEFA